jgi:copper transport protein
LAHAVLAAAVGFLLSIGMAEPAAAHAFLLRSSPGSGATLTRTPATATLEFTEPPDPHLSTLRLLDGRRRPVSTLSVHPAPGDPLAIRARLPNLPRGLYVIAWRTVSGTDGHLTGGAFAFGVGVPPARVAALAGRPGIGSRAARASSPSALAVAGRWSLFIGLALLLGAATTSLLVFGGQPAVESWAVGIAAALAVAGLLMTGIAERASVGVPWGRLLSSSPGPELLRESVAVAAVGGAALSVALRPTRGRLLALGVVSAGALLVHSMAGHAAATNPLSALNVTVEWLHLVAVAVWIGGLVWLLIGVRRLAGHPRAVAVVRFSRLAAIALALAAVSGLLRAVDEMEGLTFWRLLLHTSYGIALVVKAGLVAALIGLGGLNRYVNVTALVRGSADRRLRRTALAEVVVAAAVLVASSVLSQLPPAAQAARAAPGSSSLAVTGTDPTRAIRVSLRVTPGTIGPDRFLVRAEGARPGTPVSVTRVALQFRLPGVPEIGTPSLELRRVGGSDSWSGRGDVLTLGGRWSVRVLVEDGTKPVWVPLRVQPATA